MRPGSQAQAGVLAGSGGEVWGMSELVVGARYVVGFMFNPAEDAVLLVRKTHPDWQRGKLNGFGGQVEQGEAIFDAMRREFLEEAGIDHTDWRRFCILSDARKWQIHFFFAVGLIAKAKAMTDEKPEIVSVTALPADTIPNLHWLIPMALSMQHERITEFEVLEVKR